MDDGIFAVAKKGTMICDVSTISPVASKQFVEDAKAHGMVYCRHYCQDGCRVSRVVCSRVHGSSRQLASGIMPVVCVRGCVCVRVCGGYPVAGRVYCIRHGLSGIRSEVRCSL